MSTNSTAIKNSYDLAANVNREQFLGIVKNTVGYNELRKEDRVAYLAGAGMMFDKLAPYAQLRINIEIDRRNSVEAHGNEHKNNLQEIVRILKQYEGD